MQTKVLPVVALRGLVMFPNMVLNFDVGREKTIAAIKSAIETDGYVFMTSQIEEFQNEISIDNIHTVGTIAHINQMVKGRDGVTKVVAEGVARAIATEFNDGSRFLTANVIEVPATECELAPVAKEAYLRNIKSLFEEIVTLVPRLPKEIIKRVRESSDPFELAEYIAANVLMSPDEKQRFLEEGSQLKRLDLILSMLDKECEIIALEIDITERVQ